MGRADGPDLGGGGEMATSTPKLGLVKPAAGDPADVSVLNGNMDVLDNAAVMTPEGIQALKTALGLDGAGSITVVDTAI